MLGKKTFLSDFSFESDDKILASGGRVLNFVSVSDNYLDCRNEAINLIEKLNWKNGFYRSDIGFKVIDK